MARYGRRGRFVTCSYEEIIDFNTTGGSISVMGIHTPDDDTPRKMFPGLFQQFKKWKYLGCKIVGANAAQLPVDPLGVGYEAGEGNDTVADPRDIFDPIMFHGCHGEDLGAVLNRLYTPLHDLSDSLVAFTESEGSDTDLGRAALLEGLYYKALTDRTWRKFPIQGGIRLRGLHPLVYSLATNHYISPNDQGAEFYDPTDGTIPGFDTPNAISNATGVSVGNDTRFFTPRLQRLGWMDTRVPYMPSGNEIPSPADPDEGYADWLEKLKSTENYAVMPRIFMGVLLIPKSRRIKQYMRLRIVHYFKFAGFRGASMDLNVLGSPSFFEAESNVGDIDVPSQDDSILGGNPNDDGSGSDPEPDPEPTYTKLSIYSVSPNATPADNWCFVNPEVLTNNLPTGRAFSAFSTDEIEVEVGKQCFIGHYNGSSVSTKNEELTVPGVGVVPTSQFTMRDCYIGGSGRLTLACATITPTAGNYFLVGVYASGNTKGVENESK